MMRKSHAEDEVAVKDQVPMVNCRQQRVVSFSPNTESENKNIPNRKFDVEMMKRVTVEHRAAALFATQYALQFSSIRR